ncbi:SWI/SNF-related matrix-associated actin-dependent regulator of chromatin subfamily D member 1-like protein [Gorgonomyces haynaldii]|nr:SWI/SNF-related matrix-associated actin-dependent regulator of chromatin subfamily D member 1-like protein [Gorgonomyces haynaldii]
MSKRKRPQDKTLPYLDNVPESQLYSQLLEFEKRLDATITRKTLDVQDQLQKPWKKIVKQLRVFLSHTADGQGWTFTMQGQLVEVRLKQKPKFSQFFKQVMVDVGGQVVEWNKQQECDGFEIKGTGQKILKIMLTLDSGSELVKCGPLLSQLLNIYVDTIPNIIHALWQYIKVNKLHDPEDKRSVLCDDKMQQVFQQEKLLFIQVPELVQKQVLPVDPIILEYHISNEQGYQVNPQAYDIQVTIEDPLRENALSLASNVGIVRDLNVLDEKIASLVQAVRLSQLKRDFMLEFTSDPVGFINKWIASQSKDLQVLDLMVDYPW